MVFCNILFCNYQRETTLSMSWVQCNSRWGQIFPFFPPFPKSKQLALSRWQIDLSKTPQTGVFIHFKTKGGVLSRTATVMPAVTKTNIGATNILILCGKIRGFFYTPLDLKGVNWSLADLTGKGQYKSNVWVNENQVWIQ